MDFCFNCGGKTDPDWVFCRACGSALDEENDGAVAAAPTTRGSRPKVELISRGWDEVIDTVEVPADPLSDDDVGVAPIAPGAVEVVVDDLTVIETTEPEPSEPAKQAEQPKPVPVDRWDHLRPHGEQPPMQRSVTVPGRVGQVLTLLAALAALVAAGIHFFLNTRIDALRDGRVTQRLVDDVETVAQMSLLVAGGFIVIAALGLAWWLIQARTTANPRPGAGGIVALVSFVGGVALVASSFALDTATVTQAIGANSLIVLGLGLLIAACLATVRSVERIDRKEPA